MILPLLIAAATPEPSPSASPEALISESVITEGIKWTNTTLIFVGASIAIYLVLFAIGRFFKRRFQVPLGWFYHIFCLTFAMFVAQLLPVVDFGLAERNVNAAVVLSGAFIIITLLRHYFVAIFGRGDGMNSKVPKLLSQLVSLVVFLFAVVIVIQNIYGEPLGGLLAGAGIVGIVLGLALQDTLGNLFAGFAIYFGGQFKPGDWLKVGDEHAEIMEVNWRSTRLRTCDDIYLDIPNSNITKETVTNFSHPTPRHALRIEIGLDYDVAPTKVRKVLVEACLMGKGVLAEPAPSVFLKEFAASSITYDLKFWIEDHGCFEEILSSVRTNLWYALRRHNISIPYPIQLETQYVPTVQPPDCPALIKDGLKKVFFASVLNDGQKTYLVDHARVVSFGEGEKLIKQGDAGSSMYIILDGLADVLVDIGGAIRSVAKINPGECIGEMSLLTGEARSATIVALEDTTAVEIDKSVLAPIIADSPELVENLSDLLARRRLQNEGVLSESTNSALIAEKQQDYQSNFLRKLRKFFEL
ncbi:hypothetical protein DB345_12490 [Spartobacteria bacterium LR76]|nr:hypothetical protein DB345_12490 [Spartobacteria bacterium LR76]